MPDNNPRATEAADTTTSQTASVQAGKPSRGTVTAGDRLGTARPNPEPTHAQLVTQLHLAVSGTPGVASLVPSMATALNRLHQASAMTPTSSTADSRSSERTSPEPDEGGATDGGPDTPTDGISLTLAGQAVAVVLDIRAVNTASVLATALAVHAAASNVLELTHPGRHTVTVNVLGLDPPA